MPTVCLIQVPYDSGWRDKRMGKGPNRFLELGAAEALKRTAGPTEHITVQYEGVFASEIGTTFALLQTIAKQVQQASNAGHFPLTLAGNCNSTVGALAGLNSSRIGLVWFDGHGDFNTPETTITGFLDGMGVSMVVGHCWTRMCNRIPGFRPLPEEAVVLVGTRDLDEVESERLRESRISHVTCESLHEVGPARALETVLARWAGRVDGVYLHIDMDVHDPNLAPVNSLQPDGGLSPQDVQDCVRVVAERYKIVGASITAYDPACDPEGKGAASGLALIELLGNIAYQQCA